MRTLAKLFLFKCLFCTYWSGWNRCTLLQTKLAKTQQMSEYTHIFNVLSFLKAAVVTDLTTKCGCHLWYWFFVSIICNMIFKSIIGSNWPFNVRSGTFCLGWIGDENQCKVFPLFLPEMQKIFLSMVRPSFSTLTGIDWVQPNLYFNLQRAHFAGQSFKERFNVMLRNDINCM